jgi:hypothetical protein
MMHALYLPVVVAYLPAADGVCRASPAARLCPRAAATAATGTTATLDEQRAR